MLVTNIPEMTANQQVSTSSVSTSQGELSSAGSQFSSLMNQELNNNTGNNIVQKSPDSVVRPVQPGGELKTAGDILLSMVNDVATNNMNGAPVAPVSENKNSEGGEELTNGSEDLLKAEPSGENGLKIGALLYEILNAFQGSSYEDLPVNAINVTEGNTGEEELITGLRNLLASRPHLINEHKGNEDTDGSSDGAENQLKPELSGESGLKIGALLYEMMNACLGSNQNDSQNTQAAQCSDENGEPCQSRTNMPSEHGVKASILLSDNNPGSQQTKTGISDGKSFLDALTPNITGNTDDGDVKQLNLLKENYEHSESKNANQGKTLQAQASITDSNTTGNSAVLNRPQNIMMFEKAKEAGNTDGSGNLQNNSVKSANTETASDSFNSLNHSNMALENSRPGDGIVTGHAARPSGFTQILDNIVYVAKGNNKLDVSVEHGTLGKLDINLSLEKGILNVHINTSERAAREFIENNIQHIVNSLAKEGVNVGGLSVALKNRKDREDNAFTVNNSNDREKEIIQTVEKIRTMSGAVNIFA